jgi:hypothetical protein
LFTAALVVTLALTGCSSGPNIKKVVSPNAASLADKDRAWVLKAYKGMTMDLDGVTDADRDNFVTYAVVPGDHELKITVFSLVDETGYEYLGAPVHWSGTITTKPNLFYEISAEPNTATNSIEIRLTSHTRPLVDYEENRVIGVAAP